MENNSIEDLAAIAGARSAVADRLVTPWWYHPVLGLLTAVYILALGLGSLPVMLAGVLVFVVGCGVLVRSYRRLTGVWVSGYSAGRASRWAYALGGVVGVAAGGAIGISLATDLWWPSVCAAVLVFLATIVLGYRFDVALRAQLRAGV